MSLSPHPPPPKINVKPKNEIVNSCTGRKGWDFIGFVQEFHRVVTNERNHDNKNKTKHNNWGPLE